MSGEGKRFSEGEKNFEKKVENPLTNSPKSDIINTKGEGKHHKPERVTAMKKATLQNILSLINGAKLPEDTMNTLRDEVFAEVTKGDAQKAKNAEAYESIHDLVIGTLSATPVTVAEIWESIEGEVPEGITKGKVQYALTHLWQDEIVKVEGKPNGYRKA